MNYRIPLFQRMEIETHGLCNRKCVWCIRNSTPDKEATASWFAKPTNQLPTETIASVLDQALSLGFRGEVCLQHYNEPLMDERLPELAQMVKNRGFSKVFIGSNADFMTEELSEKLDGVLDEIGFSLYYDGPRYEKRREWLFSLFKKTPITVACAADDLTYPMLTHHNPYHDTIAIAKRFENNPCRHPLKRMIVNHKGEMLMCCDDLTGNFNLGSVHDNTLEELWYSDRHQDLVLALLRPGGRKFPGNEHCLTCPRQ